MPDPHIPSSRRRELRWGAVLRAWSRGWAPRTPSQMSLDRRVVSLVIAALMVLAAGVVTLTLGPVPAHAATANPGLPDVTVHSSTAVMTNPAHTGVTRTASCPTETLVGGGGYLRNATDPATVPINGLVLGGTNPSTGASPVDQPVTDAATNPSHWMAIANFTGVSESGDQAAAFALCTSNGPTHTVVASSTTTTGANATQQAAPPNLTIATCPTGTTLIGGGAFTKTPDQVNDGTTVGNNGNLKPLGSYPSNSSGAPAADGSTSATSWSTYGSAGITSTTDTVTSLALCTSDPIPPVQVSRVDLSGPDAQPGTTITTATTVCPTGTRMLGGGFKTDETVNGTAGLQPQQGYHMRGSYPSTGPATPPTEVTEGTTNPNSWTALVQAGGQNLSAGSSMQLHTFAMCLTANPTYATYGQSNVPKNLSIVQLQTIFRRNTTDPGGCIFKPRVPQVGSATRNVWNTLVGPFGSCVDTTNTIAENDGAIIGTDPNVIAPYGVGPWVSQTTNRNVMDVHGGAVLRGINGQSPF